jgi:hypothetical protein
MGLKGFQIGASTNNLQALLEGTGCIPAAFRTRQPGAETLD